MKYYLMCKKLLGQKQFDNLVKSLTSQVIEKYTSDIVLDEYMQILEDNIKIIMIISVCKVLNLSDKEIAEKINLEVVKDSLVTNDFYKFQEKNKLFINKITKLLS